MINDRIFTFIGAFAVGLLGCTMSIFLSPNDMYLSIADMGNSATGLELGRTMFRKPSMAPELFLGYVLNGEFTWYSNWPTIGFKVFSWWFMLMKDDTMETARLFCSVIYGINALLFFCLMLKWGTSRIVALMSTLLFISLPFHLLYGRMVFADIWLNTFWIIGCIIYKPGNRNSYWAFLLVICLGAINFMWFVIFIAPTPLFLNILRSKDWTYRVFFLRLTGVVMVILLIQWILFSINESYIVLSLQRWTIFELKPYFEIDKSNVFRRLAALAFEFFPLFFLFFGSLGYLKWSGFLDHMKSRPAINQLAVMSFSTLIIFVFSVPVWFFNHTYANGMFSVFIAVSAATIMCALERVSIRRFTIHSLGAIAISCSLFLLIPFVTSNTVEQYGIMVKSLSDLVELSSEKSEKICLFFDWPKDNSTWFHAVELAVKVEDNSYIFEMRPEKANTDLSSWFLSGMQKLNKIGYNDFSTEKAIYVSDRMPQVNAESIETRIDLNQGLYAYLVKIQ